MHEPITYTQSQMSFASFVDLAICAEPPKISDAEFRVCQKQTAISSLEEPPPPGSGMVGTNVSVILEDSLYAESGKRLRTREFARAFHLYFIAMKLRSARTGFINFVKSACKRLIALIVR